MHRLFRDWGLGAVAPTYLLEYDIKVVASKIIESLSTRDDNDTDNDRTYCHRFRYRCRKTKLSTNNGRERRPDAIEGFRENDTLPCLRQEICFKSPERIPF